MARPLFSAFGVAEHAGKSFTIAASAFGVSLIGEQTPHHAAFIAPEQLDGVIEALQRARRALEAYKANEQQERLCL